MNPVELEIPVEDDHVPALFLRPAGAKALYLFAHGAGAGITHQNMASSALGLAERGIATLRFQFLYMDKGSRRPDSPKLAHKVIRAAARQALTLAPDLPLFAGGRSFGGRMTSQAQAEDPISGVRGLIFLGFPLHPSGKPGNERATHLADIGIPMLFLSGSRDALAELELLRPMVTELGDQARLHIVDHADHSFKVTAKSGRKATEVEGEVLDAMAEWTGLHCQPGLRNDHTP